MRFRDQREAERAKAIEFRNEVVEGVRWKQSVDPDNGNYLLIEGRIPRGQASVVELEKQDAINHIIRFCAGILEGAGLIRKNPVLGKKR